MIRYAKQWKLVLTRQADALEKRMEQGRWGPAASVRLECIVVQALHALGKLIDSDLLPSSFDKPTIPVVEYPYEKRGLGLTHWRDFENHYDFTKGKTKTHPPSFLCNQMMDNCIFAPKPGENGLEAVYLTSNHQKTKALYEVSVTELIKLLRKAAA